MLMLLQDTVPWLNVSLTWMHKCVSEQEAKQGFFIIWKVKSHTDQGEYVCGGVKKINPDIHLHWVDKKWNKSMKDI